MEGFVYTY